MSEHQDPRPRDDTDATQNLARDLADVAHQISALKGEANAYLSDPDYDTLRLRLDNAHAASRRLRWRRGGACGSTREGIGE